MAAAKPDCSGQKFGYLTVLKKAGRSSKNTQLWLLQCDCGNIVQKPRSSFACKINPSCGCQKILKTIERNKNRALPDITGKRFGRLIVLGKGKKKLDNLGCYRQYWRMQCDCGNIVEIERGSVEKKGQISCGCARKLGLINNNRYPIDITNKKFGNITIIALSGKKDYGNKPTWISQCDCGNICEKSLSDIRRRENANIRINCGDPIKHPEKGLWYPITPNLYPKEAGKLLIKYLYLTELNYKKIDSQVEDEKKDLLIRACYILSYRRSQGEEISELHEKKYISKCLYFASINVFWQRKLELNGGYLHKADGMIKEINQIGDVMTDKISFDYPVIETQGIKILTKKLKLKFKRC